MSTYFRRAFLLAAASAILAGAAVAGHSVARDWNEALLQAIRKDLARPTVHARNLFHTSMAMYDAWAAYDHVAETFLLGKTVGGFTVPFNGIAAPADLPAARNEAISYAAYRILKHRFLHSPGATASAARFDSLMLAYGYDTLTTSTDYSTGRGERLCLHVLPSLQRTAHRHPARRQHAHRSEPLAAPNAHDVHRPERQHHPGEHAEVPRTRMGERYPLRPQRRGAHRPRAGRKHVQRLPRLRPAADP
jgi:hypothetical protein